MIKLIFFAISFEFLLVSCSDNSYTYVLEGGEIGLLSIHEEANDIVRVSDFDISDKVLCIRINLAFPSLSGDKYEKDLLDYPIKSSRPT